ncbi:hypothetical protein INT43_003869 [Umbelopsis isabellina]|uniref:Uncharacterized protein n=1 Tax=Mortierella isabellina TaxID=91625 RepID=A0A8H7UFU0_MORIS|nr:hypothetical protein INT43_003869 [Umbelopsis isabellina]
MYGAGSSIKMVKTVFSNAFGREHAQVKDLWMDYRAHHRHVINVIGDEVKKDLDARSNPIVDQESELSQYITSSLTTLEVADADLNDMNIRINEQLQECAVQIARKHQDISEMRDIEPNGPLYRELAMITKNLKVGEQLLLLCSRMSF